MNQIIQPREISEAERLKHVDAADSVPRRAKPRSDVGTIVLHWATAAAVVVSLATGLRIGGDGLDSVVGRALWSVLPQGEVWTWHFVGSLALFFCATAYAVYMARAGLLQRIAPSRMRVLTMPASARLRWNAVNVALHWAIYAILAALTATGVAMYLGFGGWVVTVHGLLATVTLVYIGVHVFTHFMYGGLDQLLRLFKPSRLARTAAARPRPFVVAAFAGLPIAIGVAALDYGTRDTLTVAHVATPPTADGKLDDAAWANARPVRVRTEQGANLGGTGTSTVEVRAVEDGRKIYFAFWWEDPTRSQMRLPLVKREDGWRLIGSKADTADVVDYYEDKLAVLFTRSDAFGNGGSTHMGPAPLPGQPKPLHGRGYHYTADGLYADVWQWKASRGGLLGRVDDMYFGPPNEANEAMKAGKARYQAGYDSDPGTGFYVYNYKSEAPGGYRGPVTLSKLPKDYAATVKAMGTLHLDVNKSNDEGSRWWMTEDEVVPYSKEADDRIPVGTVIPGVLIQGQYSGDRADLMGAAQWKDGYWTLETSRVLDTGSKYDIPFKKGEPIYMYLSVFDHTQTRHTRHMRPIVIALP
ncbi:ethylbenzene dehydrogenase-related protein [Alsobacter sp. SYSU BS001988]